MKTLLVIRFLQATLVVAAIVGFFEAQWTLLFTSVAALLATFLPAYLGRNIKLNLPLSFHLIITLFVYATLFLGEVGNFYERFWWWDVVLHTGSAIVFGIIGFIILYTLYDTNRLAAHPIFVALFSFAFAVAIGAIWEIFEFAMDQTFGLSMQKSGLVDTMWDLIVDSVGALAAATAGYFYIVTKGKGGGFLTRLIKSFFGANPHLAKE